MILEAVESSRIERGVRLTQDAADYIGRSLPLRPEWRAAVSEGSFLLAGHQSLGLWDECTSLDLRLVLPPPCFRRLARDLREEWATPAGPAGCFVSEDPRPFRCYPGVRLTVESTDWLERGLREEPSVCLWAWTHAAAIRDPDGCVAGIVESAAARFQAELEAHRCRHYFLFRRARQHMERLVTSGNPGTDLAIQRGMAIREALRLAFLVEGRPFPADPWLESLAQETTAAGPSIVIAVRGLVSAQEADTVERASKVLRDRVIQAMQRAGITEPWLEWWWAWPGWSSE